MSMDRARGQLIWVDDHATHDDFKDMNVVSINIKLLDGQVVARNIPVGRCFKTGYPLPLAENLYPAIGDMIAIGWDYHYFEGYIYEYAPEPRQPIGDPPVTGARAFSLTDILRSLSPDEPPI